MGVPQALMNSIERSLLRHASMTHVQRAALKWEFALRRLLLVAYDWPVRHRIGEFNLLFPMSHNFPIDDAAAPERSDNLRRIAAVIQAHVKDFRAIDIGANVGDSVAILRRSARFPVLAIEGDHEFYQYLSKNMEAIPDVWTLEGLLSDSAQTVQGSLVRNYGGSKQVATKTENDRPLQFLTLPQVLDMFPDFRQAQLVKIDTDGFDCKIMRGAMIWLETARPTVFFEYDPHHLEEQKDDGISIFREMQAIGYDGVLVFEENGDFMRSLSLNDHAAVAELHYYFLGRKPGKYANLCVFHGINRSLFEAARRQELQFALNQRSSKNFQR